MTPRTIKEYYEWIKAPCRSYTETKFLYILKSTGLWTRLSPWWLWCIISYFVMLFWSVRAVLQERLWGITCLHGQTISSLCLSYSCHHLSPWNLLFLLSWLTPPLLTSPHLCFLSFLCRCLMGFPKLFPRLSVPYIICWPSAGIRRWLEQKATLMSSGGD